MEYKSFLSRIDGMPPLWPRAPNWPNDEKLRLKLQGELGLQNNLLNWLLQSTMQQKQIDQRWGHFNYLINQSDPDEKKTVGEWSKQLLRVAGWQDGHFSNPKQLVTANEFGMQYREFMALADSYTPPEVPVPRKCDECKRDCTSECFCGEIYCSRKCMKKAWKGKNGHRYICETVFENGEFGALLTQMEMSKCLSQDEMDQALGVTTEEALAERAKKRAADQKKLEDFVAAESSQTMKAFANMRLKDRAPIIPGNTGIARVMKGGDISREVANASNDAIYRKALYQWTNVMLYEVKDLKTEEADEVFPSSQRCTNGEDCVRAFSLALQIDDTVAQMPQPISTAFPRIIKATRDAINKRKSNPELAAHGYLVMSQLCLFDPSLGNALEQMDILLNDAKLRQYLSNLPAAIYRRSAIRITLNPHPSVHQSCKEDCLEAVRLAEEKGDLPTAWSLYYPTSKIVRNEDESRAFKIKFIQIAEAALAFNKELKPKIKSDAEEGDEDDDAYPGTGGQERNPNKLVKVASSQYELALLYFIDARKIGDSTKQGRQLIAKAREQYISAQSKEALLPTEVLDQLGPEKSLCQGILSMLPMSSKQTRDLVNPGCYECDNPNAGFSCSKCRRAVYCSKECQVKHWKNGHKQECKAIK